MLSEQSEAFSNWLNKIAVKYGGGLVKVIGQFFNLGRLFNALSVQKKIPFQLKTKARDWLQNMNLIFDFDHWCFNIFFHIFSPWRFMWTTRPN